MTNTTMNEKPVTFSLAMQPNVEFGVNADGSTVVGFAAWIVASNVEDERQWAFRRAFVGRCEAAARVKAGRLLHKMKKSGRALDPARWCPLSI